MVDAVFAKSGRLSRFILRKERVRIPLWLAGLTFFTLIVPIAFKDLYPTQEERDAMAEGMRNPAMTAMVGPGDLDHYTIGAMTAHQMLLFTAVVVGLMNILLVTRHTRGEEEDGSAELVRSLPVGRLSYVHAALSVMILTNVVLALLTGFGLYALRLDSMDLEGSLLYGAVIGAIGLFFAAVTVLFAQFSASSRATIGYAVTVLVLSYLVRAIGDVVNDAISWFSPLGWVTKAEVYTNNRWGPVWLTLGASALLLAAAYYLQALRDLGAGFLPPRPGRKHASSLLRRPTGLALRLQRTGMIAWAVGMLLIGLSYGSVLGDLELFFSDNEMMRQFLSPAPGVSLTEQFIPMLMAVMAILGTIPPVMVVNKLYSEEKKGRMGHVLGGAVSRTRLMTGYVTLAAVNGFVMLSLAALGLWSAGTTVMEEPFAFGTVFGAAIAYYPAVLVIIGAAASLIGTVPRLASVVWLYLFFSFVVVYLGGLFQFPDWVETLSPYGHIPELPVEDVDYNIVFVLVAVAILLVAVGLTGYRRRDVDG